MPTLACEIAAGSARAETARIATLLVISQRFEKGAFADVEHVPILCEAAHLLCLVFRLLYFSAILEEKITLRERKFRGWFRREDLSIGFHFIRLGVHFNMGQRIIVD